MKRRPKQLELPTWGGRRPGAGRKPTPGRRPGVPHRPRTPHDARCPAHATFRARKDIPSLRSDRVFVAVQGAIAAASRARFRVLHFSVQANRLHVVVEANTPTGLVRGLQGLGIRIARAVNRALRRHGAVWDDRYHARTLATASEVRHALVYVLQNWRKHVPNARGVDARSSAAWFDGWRTAIPRPPGPSPVAPPRTWLARVRWRRHGLIDIRERPRKGP